MSDSDRTIDSDELAEMISLKKRKHCSLYSEIPNTSATLKKVKHSEKIYEMSDSSTDIEGSDSDINRSLMTICDHDKAEIMSDSIKNAELPASESQTIFANSNSLKPENDKRTKPRNSSIKSDASSCSDVKNEGTTSESNSYAPQPSTSARSTYSKSNNLKESEKIDNRPKCSYGINCYRKNPDHIRKFSHNEDVDQQTSSNGIAPHESQENLFGFYLTTVLGLPSIFNCEKVALGIKDLLREPGKKLIASAQFNYVFDIPWLVGEYPAEFRNCPITIVHGEQGRAKQSLETFVKTYPNITFCQAKLDIPYGTHHTKMMLLLYEDGLKVVIHTANLVPNDWSQKTQGMWVSPVFPQIESSLVTEGESATKFKASLIDYISAYRIEKLKEWSSVLQKHDMSQANVFIIGSVPGRHVGPMKTAYGHLKLRKVLNLHGLSKDEVNIKWPVVAQFSSIGSLGTSSESWLCGEWHQSLGTTKGSTLSLQKSSLKLVFPTIDNVRMSFEGYPAGASLPYSINVATKQHYLQTFLHQWKSGSLCRNRASPHIKTYFRLSPDNKKMAWFLLTSANLSKAAWGTLEKNNTQFMIRSYELGVLFLPKYFGVSKFSLSCDDNGNASEVFQIPVDVPLTPYTDSDKPWIWDIPHVNQPDSHGNMWCPS